MSKCDLLTSRSESSGKRSVARFRVTVLGSEGVGKSALTVRYITKRFLYEYDPAAKLYSKEITINGHKTELQILDASTQQEYEDASESIRMSSSWSDGFVLVYSVTDASSLKSAIEMKTEIDEKRKFRPAHFILVGNKSDLVQHRRVSEREGRSAAESLSCCFTEASARDNVAVDDTFERALRTMGTNPRRNSIIGIMSSPASHDKRKKTLLSRAKAKLGHSTPIMLMAGMAGKRMSQPDTRALTMKEITSMRRASVA